MTYRSNGSYWSNRTNRSGRVIPPHGGYRKLKSYQTTEIIYDGTMDFCERQIRSWKLREQMEGAARSGKQNIAEGCQVSGTSKRSELKLLSVARGSLEELLQDYLDFLRQRGLERWGKDDPRAREIRELAYGTDRTDRSNESNQSDRSYETYRSYVEKDPETAANTLICLIHQANYLLDRQIAGLERRFLEEGGFSERLFKERQEAKKSAGRRREEENDRWLAGMTAKFKAEKNRSNKSNRSDRSDRAEKKGGG